MLLHSSQPSCQSRLGALTGLQQLDLSLGAYQA